MAVNLSALAGAGQQFFDNNGNVLSGGKLWSYEAGTTTPQATYTTVAGNVAHTNPIILDSAGRVPSGQIWLDAGENYKFVLMTSADVTLASYDNITGINGTGITSNAVNVTYDPAGAGAVSTTVQTKLRETVSVKDFGAVGDGSDESAKFQAAINAAVGKILFVPKPQSKYVVTGLLIPSNVIIEGEGYDTIIEMKQDANAFARMFLINGLTGQPKFNIAVRNLHFMGTVVANGFSEFRHLFYMWGATNITVENNWFTGWQGDALDIVQTPGTEYNENITVQNNVFDGVNNDNRNAISIIGCNKLLIDNNIFMNCTRSNMPGAIDIEPNTGYTFVILNAVTISNNRFENIGGNVGAMAMFLPVFSEDFVEHPKNITIENNTFSDVFRGIHCTQLQSVNVNDSDPFINLQIINNKVDGASDRAFWLYGLNGVVMENNTYQNCANSSRIGWSDLYRGCNNVKLRNNTFKENGTVDGIAIQSYQSNRVQFYENTFIDCGLSAGGFGVCINFVTASVSNIRIIDNSIVNPSGKTTGAIGKTGAITISYDQNILQMNNFAGLIDAATSAPQWFSGTGSPLGVVTAPIGSLYVNVSGGAGTTLFVKESGAFATGWAAK